MVNSALRFSVHKTCLLQGDAVSPGMLSASKATATAFCNAGTTVGNTTVVTGATSVYDVNMADLAHMLLPELAPAKIPEFAERTPRWLAKQRAQWVKHQMQQAYCGLSPAGCDPKPLQQVADAVVARGHTQQLQVRLFKPWKVQHQNNQT